LIAVDRDIGGGDLDFIGTDDTQGGRLAAEHLLGLGHRRLAHLAAPPADSTARNRKAGFDAAVSKVVGARAKTVDEESWLVDPVAVRELLMHPDRPTAIFCDSDMMVLSVYTAARQTALRIPEDLSVVGFADLHFSASLYPGLTTVRQHPREIGRRAARLALDRIEGRCDSDDPVVVRLEPELIERGSTDEPPGSF
jgi:LacI family transcriptional regulator